MKRFESKKDRWIVIVCWGSVVILLVTAGVVAFDGSWLLNLILQPLHIGTIYLCLSVLYQTYYVITGDILIIRSGPVLKKIKISDIQKVTKTRDMLSSPALSLDRIKLIPKGTPSGIMLSPEDRDLFLREIGFDPVTFTKLS